MRASVCEQAICVRKLLAASGHIALVGLLTRVCPCMRREHIGLCECLPASWMLALIRLLPRVGLHVAQELLRNRERLLLALARRPFANVLIVGLGAAVCLADMLG